MGSRTRHKVKESMKKWFWQNSKGTERESYMFSCKRTAWGVWTEASSKKTEEQQGHCRCTTVQKKLLKKKRTSSAYLNFVQSCSSLSMVAFSLPKVCWVCMWYGAKGTWMSYLWVCVWGGHIGLNPWGLINGFIKVGGALIWTEWIIQPESQSETSVVACRRHPGTERRARQGGN